MTLPVPLLLLIVIGTIVTLGLQQHIPLQDWAPIATSLTMKRLQSGENYQIMGKRQGQDGGVEYLIGWEGVKSRCLKGLGMY